MKTVVLFLMVIGISLGTTAQNLEVKPMPKIDFNKGWQKEKLLSFNDSPRLNFEIPQGDLDFSQTIPQLPDENNVPALPPEEYAAYQLRMPVVGGRFSSRMPVVVPDSTVHYFLKIKRIPFVNPLDKRWK
ncbi:MAG TPA: hypothetical protein VKA38_09315 [Draconibacterium sp.]|nr:hypothetical protein [Draconibacterium sp.]